MNTGIDAFIRLNPLHEGECDCLTQGLAPDTLVSPQDDSLHFLQIALSTDGFDMTIITFKNISKKWKTAAMLDYI